MRSPRRSRPVSRGGRANLLRRSPRRDPIAANARSPATPRTRPARVRWPALARRRAAGRTPIASSRGAQSSAETPRTDRGRPRALGCRPGADGRTDPRSDARDWASVGRLCRRWGSRSESCDLRDLRRGFERLDEPFAGVVQAPPERRLFAVQDFRDLATGEPLEVVQPYRKAIRFAQGFERREHASTRGLFPKP